MRLRRDVCNKDVLTRFFLNPLFCCSYILSFGHFALCNIPTSKRHPLNKSSRPIFYRRPVESYEEFAAVEIMDF